MTSEKARALCVHGHFYQPSRENPFSGNVPREVAAAPYHDFNEKITEECYRPNARLGNYQRISFNFGPALLCWLEANATHTYQAILAAEKVVRVANGVGNALAQGYHHTILPLASRRDKVTQLLWGIADFAHRFSHPPSGLWLPEMAVDLETLEVMAEAAIAFTVLDQHQLVGEVKGAGPYRVDLSDDRSIAVFVRDTFLSNQISFSAYRGTSDLGPAMAWVHSNLKPRWEDAAPLTLIAVDGENFGHHHQDGARFLHDLVNGEAAGAGYEVVCLTKYLKENPPQQTVSINENTSWSCSHGLARWSTGCACTLGDSSWKPALRNALRQLAEELDLLYVEACHQANLDFWLLRDRYIRVVLGEAVLSTLLAEQGAQPLSTEVENRLELLLRSQLHRQAMFASDAFFFEDLDRLEPRYAIANGAKAISLAYEATGQDLIPQFRANLEKAVSGANSITGAQMLDQVLGEPA